MKPLHKYSVENINIKNHTNSISQKSTISICLWYDVLDIIDNLRYDFKISWLCNDTNLWRFNPHGSGMVVVAYQFNFILILLHHSWTSRHLTRPIDLPMVFMMVTEFYVLVKQSKMSALLFIPVDPQHYDCLCNGSRRCATTDIIALISHVQSHSLLFLLMAPGKHCSGEPVFSEPNPCVRQVV